MANDYTRQRLDRITEDVAITRTKVEAMERTLAGMSSQREGHETRLMRMERRVAGLWLAGPILLGGTAFFQTFKTWLTER